VSCQEADLFALFFQIKGDRIKRLKIQGQHRQKTKDLIPYVIAWQFIR